MASFVLYLKSGCRSAAPVIYIKRPAPAGKACVVLFKCQAGFFPVLKYYICRVMARNVEFIPEEKVSEAMNVFWSKGYTAASLADLTGAMKINKSSLYNSFGDKHTLFKACLKAYLKLTEHNYATAVAKGNTALEQLEAIIDMIVSVSTGRDNSCMGVKTSFELGTDDKEVKAVIRSGNDKTIKMMTALITEAQQDGVINSNRNAATMAHFVFNSFAGLRQSFIVYGKLSLVKQLGEELKSYLRQ